MNDKELRKSQSYKSLKNKLMDVSQEELKRILKDLDRNKAIRLEDKAAILNRLTEYRLTKNDQTEVVKRFVDDYNSRSIEPAQGIHKRIEKVSRTSLFRWEKIVSEQGWGGLVDDYKAGKQSYLTKYPSMLRFLDLLIEDFPKAHAKLIYDCLVEEAKKQSLPMPIKRAIYDYVRNKRKIKKNK